MQNENLQTIVALVLALLILAFLTYLAVKLIKAIGASINARPDFVAVLAFSSLIVGLFGLFNPAIMNEGVSLLFVAGGLFSLMVSAITYKHQRG